MLTRLETTVTVELNDDLVMFSSVASNGDFELGSYQIVETPLPKGEKKYLVALVCDDGLSQVERITFTSVQLNLLTSGKGTPEGVALRWAYQQVMNRQRSRGTDILREP